MLDMQYSLDEGRLEYRGVARVHLDDLEFQQPLGSDPIKSDPRRVEYLKRRFQKEGCDRLPVLRHIPVIIDQQSLDAAMRDSCVSAQRLLKAASPYPYLAFPKGFQLRYIHGLHRIEAGREILSGNERWWTVDLYLSGRLLKKLFSHWLQSTNQGHRPGLSANLRRVFDEEYANDEIASDGEIYCNLRYHQQHENSGLRMRWESRLRGRRADNLSALNKNEALAASFDALMDIPGLWDGMMLTTLSKMVALRCDTVGKSRMLLQSTDPGDRKSKGTCVTSSRSGHNSWGEKGMPWARSIQRQ